jgi:hypothetical protein
VIEDRHALTETAESGPEVRGGESHQRQRRATVRKRIWSALFVFEVAERTCMSMMYAVAAPCKTPTGFKKSDERSRPS